MTRLIFAAMFALALAASAPAVAAIPMKNGASKGQFSPVRRAGGEQEEFVRKRHCLEGRKLCGRRCIPDRTVCHVRKYNPF